MACSESIYDTVLSKMNEAMKREKCKLETFAGSSSTTRKILCLLHLAI
ncbi:unnamed protein product [Blumeria hordei]|uniref:Uncharacterized protein n=1 Tax=Blumeria hordei TaxID=2867405 RepID=A0A383UW15_BLUHO|nr:unnamed protein product [Blumeria hordei]